MLSAVISSGEFAGVYVGPWWEVGSDRLPGPGAAAQAWKCAVLRRRTGGAEHWGHLFLVLGTAAPGAPKVEPVPLMGSHRVDQGPTRTFPASTSEGRVVLLARGHTDQDPAGLWALAERVQRALDSA